MSATLWQPTPEDPEYYRGTTFVNYQSGNEPSDRLLKLMEFFTCEMHDMRIRTYWGLQIGKPIPPNTCPPGGNCNE